MPERATSPRRHRVFMTKHTEYHLRDFECVGVRDRRSGLWILNHAALRLQALTVPPMGEGARWIGQRLQFWGKRTDVLTSPVVNVERPMRQDVGAYVSQARGGAIGNDAAGLLVSSPA